MGLGGRLGPCSNLASASGGGGGGGILGMGGDQSVGGSNGALTNDGGVEHGLSLGGGGLAGFELLARIIVGFAETDAVVLTDLCLLRGSSLLNSKGTEFWNCFDPGRVSIVHGSAAIGVDELEVNRESKSSSKPLST